MHMQRDYAEVHEQQSNSTTTLLIQKCVPMQRNNTEMHVNCNIWGGLITYEVKYNGTSLLSLLHIWHPGHIEHILETQNVGQLPKNESCTSGDLKQLFIAEREMLGKLNVLFLLKTLLDYYVWCNQSDLVVIPQQVNK